MPKKKITGVTPKAVSYTHLDVYKRQETQSQSRMSGTNDMVCVWIFPRVGRCRKVWCGKISAADC